MARTHHEASHHKHSAAGAAEDGLPPFPAFSSENMGAVLSAQRAMLDGMIEANRELLDFTAKRLSADFDTMDRLCHCKDWNEAAKVQSDSVEAMAKQYFDQTMKLMNSAAKMLAMTKAVARVTNGD